MNILTPIVDQINKINGHCTLEIIGSDKAKHALGWAME
jgi:hypothetical protein